MRLAENWIGKGLTADTTENAATYFSTDSVGDFRTRFNIILLVRYGNISVAVMYCYSYLPLRTHVFALRYK
jgi:hypothetical protein